MTRTRRLTLLLACSALAVGAQTAAADVRISIGGGGHIRIGGGGHARAHWVRHHHRVHVGGAIWIGGVYRQPFAQPPPPPPPPQPACNCEPSYYPIAPQPVAYAAVAPAPEPRPLSRFGLGVFLGGVAVDGEHEGKDAGLVAQLRVGRRFQLEAELAKNELADGAREDRRFMAGLQFELNPHRRLTPYAVAAVGTTQVQVGETWEDSQKLGELGGGLRLRLSERFTLFGDLRFGQRELADRAVRPLDESVARIVPADEERYSRMRLGGLMTF